MESMDLQSRIKLSKCLSWILRHGSEKLKLEMDKNGWVKLVDILQLPHMKEVKESQIEEIVRNCPKQRYAIKDLNHERYIRANQGHSFQNIDLELPKLDGATCPLVYHGTYLKLWPSIKEQGLSKMNRQHVHLTDTIPDFKDTNNKIRSNCDILIEINVSLLIKDGFNIYKSANDVILCPGNDDGFIPPKYFTKCIDRSGNEIWGNKMQNSCGDLD